jgi:replicative DNA helicase
MLEGLPPPPSDRSQELALVGACILGGRVTCTEVRNRVRPEMLWYAPARLAYDAAQRLAADGTEPDLVQVCSALSRAGLLEGIGGPQALRDAILEAVTSENASHYAEAVRSTWARREVILRCCDLVRRAYETDATGADFAASAATEIGRIAEDATPAQGGSWESILQDALDPRTAPEAVTLRTLPRTVEEIGCLWKGSLAIVCGRPGHGKSMLLRTAARSLAQEGRVVYAAIEEGADGTACSLLAGETGIAKGRVRSRQLSRDEMRQCLDAASVLQDLQLDIDSHAGPTVDHIAAIAHRAARRGPLAAVVVDYLGLIDHQQRRGDSLAVAIGRTTRRLKVLARELRTLVMVGAQLNREGQRGGWQASRPRLHELRDSGSIEQDADSVWSVWSRAKAQGADTPQPCYGMVEIDVLKDRWSDPPRQPAVVVADGATLRDGASGPQYYQRIAAYRAIPGGKGGNA